MALLPAVSLHQSATGIAGQSGTDGSGVGIGAIDLVGKGAAEAFAVVVGFGDRDGAGVGEGVTSAASVGRGIGDGNSPLQPSSDESTTTIVRLMSAPRNRKILVTFVRADS